MGIAKFLSIKKNKSLFNGTLFSIFSFANKGMGFILLIFLANFITPEDYGYLSLYTTIVMFLSYFVGLSTNGYQSITFFKSSQEEVKKDTTCILTITFISFLLLYVILFIGKDVFPHLANLSFQILQLAIWVSFLNFIYAVNLEFFRIKEQIWKYGYLSCGHTLINFVLSIVLVIPFSLSWKGRIYAEVISAFIFFLIGIYYFYKTKLITYQGLDFNRYKRIMAWGIPLIPHLAANWVKQGGDRYIIESHHSMTDVGLFSFALNLTNIIIMIGVAFNASNSVEIYKTLSIKNNSKEFIIQQIRKKEITFIYLYLIASITIILSGSLVMPYILPQYADSIPYFIILGIYGFLQCIYFIYCNYLFYFKKNKIIMYVTFTSSILHLILSLFLTQYSLYLTATIYVISQTYILLNIYYLSKQTLKKELVS